MSGCGGGMTSIEDFEVSRRKRWSPDLRSFTIVFLTIHPFMDANGRVARSITDQPARELLNQRIGREFIEDAQAYYAALAAADLGDLKPLQDRIKAVLTVNLIASDQHACTYGFT
jgi:fido (protein-threonine AMPylation protein)